MSVRILATRGTEAQIQAVSSASQSEGQIAYATDTKEFYVSDGTQFNKIGKDQLSQFSEISVVNNVNTWYLSADNILDLNPPEANPSGITFKPDGTKMFTIGYSRNRVQSYDLSTAWDITSAGSPTESENLVQNYLGSTQEDFFIDSSGTRMYVLSRNSDSVGQFTLNTAWDISDITFVQDVHMNSTSLSGGVAGFVTGETNPAGITFKPDGTIMYIAGYQLDEVQQIPLSTAWDISTHGTITSISLSPTNYAQAIQFSVNGKEMYILDYNLDAIVHFTLSTAWDVTTANLTEQTQAFITADEGTPTGLFYRDDLSKCFIVGRGGDFAREVIANDVISFNEGIIAPVVYSPELNGTRLTTGGGGSNQFFNTTVARSTFQSDGTTYLGNNSGGQNVRVGNTVYGNYRFHVFPTNYINNTFINNPTELPNIRFFNPLIGGVGTFSIGKTYNTTTVYLRGGVTDIDSEADTFSHLGEFTLGGELKVTANQPLKYKDPNLYTQGTQIVLDNFTEASDTDLLNHTPDTGSGYTEVYVSSGANNSSDYAKISGGNGYVGPARNNSSDGFRFTNDTTISTANYEARAVIRKQVASDDPFVLFVKYIDEDNYFAMHFSANYSYCTPMSVVGGVHTQHGALYYYANTSTADDVNFEVALRVVGNNVHVFYEGRYRGSREVNITGIGKAGIGFGRSNDSILTSYDLGTNAQISKFEIYELPDSLFDGSDSVHYIENGSLGIGTTSPSATLDIEDASGVTIDINSSSGDGQFRFQDNAVTKWSIGRDNTQQNFVFSNSAGLSNDNVLVLTHTDGNVGIGTTTPAAKLDVHGTISQTVDAATNEYPLSFYNSHAGTNFYLLRQRVVNTGNQVRTGLGITGVPSCAFEIGPKTDQILRFTTSGTISNVSTINGNNPLKINATEIRTGDTSGSVGANLNIVGDNNRVPLGIKQESGASQDRFITFRNSSNTEVLGIATTGGFTVTDSNLVKRFEFGHGYSPSPADGMGIGLDLKTENASGSIVSVGIIDVIQDDVSADLNSMRLRVGETTPTEIMRLESSGNVGIGTTSPDSTALLDVRSTTKGVLFPRMTEEQRGAIEEPATGLIVYQTDATEGLYIYKSTGWTQII